MARVKFTALVEAARGKYGDTVFSRNKSGNYLRQQFIPHNPKTSEQSLVRGNFGGFASAWRGLTEGQREGWVSMAVDYTYLNVFGDGYKLSGFQLFQKVNMSRSVIWGTQLSSAPAPVEVPGISGNIVITGNTAAFTANLTSEPDPALPCGIVVSVTRAVSPGKMVPGNNDFRPAATVLGTTSTVEVSPLPISLDRVFPGGVVTAGVKFFWKAVLIMETGQRSQEYNGQIITE